jgi:DNA-binding winged helix-turn-helix (wHTH) protein/tetratricopeptide (TPR) repeat protein
MRYRFGRFELDEEAGELRREGKAVPLQPKPFGLLQMLLRERERVVENEEIFEALWPGVTVTPSSLTRAVSLARRAIGDTNKGALISHLARRGYRFTGEVTEIGRPRRGEAPQAPATPTPATSADADPFVGRSDAEQTLRGAWHDAASGRGGLVLVSGAAGIGKTRLVGRLVAEAERSGGVTLLGRCREDVPAFWPWAQVLRGLLERGAEPATLLEQPGVADELIEWLPELATSGSEPEPGSDAKSAALSPEQQRFLLFEAVARMLLRESRRDPLLVWLEDVQWAGASSLRLLEHLAYEVTEARLLLVVTVRDEPRPRDHPVEQVLPTLRQQPRSVDLPLRHLSRGDVSALLEQVIGRAPPSDLTSELFAHSEGVPLFLREAIRLLAERGDLAHPERVRRWALTLPARALDLIRQPLDRLSPACLALVESGAVLGREFPLGLVAAVADEQRDAALDLLDEAERAGVLEAATETPGSWRFVHALFREAAYDAISAGSRARLHARAAVELERRHAGELEQVVSELATHHHAALAVVDPERAFELAVRAARRATRLLAHDHAVTHYGQALAALDQLPTTDSGRRLETLIALGEAHLLAGERERRRAVFAEAMDAARAQGRALEAAVAAVGFCDLADWAAEDPEAYERVADALELVPDGADALRAALLTRLAYLSMRRAMERSESLAREAVAAARQAGDILVLQEALYALFFRLAGPDHLKERATVAEEMLEAVRASRLTDTSLIAMLDMASDRVTVGDLAEATRWRDRVEPLLGAEPRPVLLWHVRTFDAGVAIAQGRFEAAERLVGESARLGQRIEHPYARGVDRALRAWLMHEQGRHEEVLEIFPPRRPVRIGPRQWVGAVIGRTLAALGRADEARLYYEDLMAAGPETIPRNIRWHGVMAELAHLCADLGDADGAESILALLEPVAEQHGVRPLAIHYVGPFTHPLARLHQQIGELRKAERLFERALESVDALGAKPARRRILVDYAELLVATGDAARAGELRAEAAALARSFESAS